MKRIFADTFYWVALTNPQDASFHRALAMGDRLANAVIVTSDEVLIEFLAFFAADPWLRQRAAEAVILLLRTSIVQVIAQSRATFLAGLQLYRERLDKQYSLTDCIAMQIMRQEGLTEVFTNDRHFEQEGFAPLFRDN